MRCLPGELSWKFRKFRPFIPYQYMVGYDGMRHYVETLYKSRISNLKRKSFLEKLTEFQELAVSFSTLSKFDRQLLIATVCPKNHSRQRKKNRKIQIPTSNAILKFKTLKLSKTCHCDNLQIFDFPNHYNTEWNTILFIQYISCFSATVLNSPPLPWSVDNNERESAYRATVPGIEEKKN